MINDRLIDSISNLISDHVISHNTCQGLCIMNLNFQTSLGYRNALGVPPILLCQLALGVVNGDIHRILVPIYHEPCHWAWFLLDMAAAELCYTDSLDYPPPKNKTNRILKWTSQFTGLPFTVRPPLHVPQQLDSVSCGIVALNLMENLALETELWSDSTKVLTRAEYSLCLCVSRFCSSVTLEQPL
jgi:Ulp1 family protease